MLFSINWIVFIFSDFFELMNFLKIILVIFLGLEIIHLSITYKFIKTRALAKKIALFFRDDLSSLGYKFIKTRVLSIKKNVCMFGVVD